MDEAEIRGYEILEDEWTTETVWDGELITRPVRIIKKVRFLRTGLITVPLVVMPASASDDPAPTVP